MKRLFLLFLAHRALSRYAKAVFEPADEIAQTEQMAPSLARLRRHGQACLKLAGAPFVRHGRVIEGERPAVPLPELFASGLIFGLLVFCVILR